MNAWTSENQKRYRWYKSMLTRRVNWKDWQGVIDLWVDFEEEWTIMPDDWRRWERAAEDARCALRRQVSAEREWI